MRKRLKREMHSTERADNFLFPTITIVTIGALILSFWDFIVLQQSVYRFGWLNIIGFAFFYTRYYYLLGSEVDFGQIFL